MVVADDAVAAEWGAEVLRRGGNAVDAAVATAFAMSVTRPHYASLGGGGFLVYCPAAQTKAVSMGTPSGKAPECVTIDYREKAPAAVARDFYAKPGKDGKKPSSVDGAAASGVPGVTAGLLMALEKYGTWKRDKILSKPIELAEKGITFTGRMEWAANDRWDVFNDDARRIFGCGGTLAKHPKPCEPGATILQPELGRVLIAISKKGRDGFYTGWIAKRLADGIQAAGGLISVADLAGYQPSLRQPLIGAYRGFEIVTMPPPSGGGVALLQMLKFAELGDSELAEGYGAVRSVHALAHGMSLAFADRAQWLGDADFVKVPVAGLLDDEYLKQRWSSFIRKKAGLPELAGTPIAASSLKAETKTGTNTTHFSVVDRFGGAVAVTTTVNENFGSGFIPPGTGVVMNNQMDDFATQPGVPNIFGLVGSEANSVAPGKRPLSSMAPTIVREKSTGEVRLVLGAQGGPRITTGVFQTLVNRLRFGMSLPDSVDAARFHQQWRPTELMLEKSGFAADVQQKLKEMGYALKEVVASGRLHAIERFANGRVWGAPDRRAEGAAVAE